MIHRAFLLNSFLLPPHSLLQRHMNSDEWTQSGHRQKLRIGVTGHIGLDPDTTKMNALLGGVAEVITYLERVFPNSDWIVISSLAMGADRLLTEALLTQRGSRLVAVLPMPQNEYAKDFGATDDLRIDPVGAARRQEFYDWLKERAVEVIELPLAPTREKSYQKAGFFIADHCNVLMAVWDGLPAQGTGGTAEVVHRAVSVGKPVCHVWAGNYKHDPKKRTNVGKKHGSVRCMNFPGQKPGEWIDLV